MANQIDGEREAQGAVSGIDQELRSLREKEKSRRSTASGGRDDRLEADLDRERQEPGLDAEGIGAAGADPGKAQRKAGNSNT